MDEDKGLYYRPLTPLTIYQLLHRSLVLAESWDSESIKHVVQGRLSSKEPMPVSLMAAVGFWRPRCSPYRIMFQGWVALSES